MSEVLTKTDLARIFRTVMAGATRFSEGEYLLMRAVEAAVVAARVVPTWQSIETAPKDRTEVLLWREDCGQFIGSYTRPEAFPLTQEEIDGTDEASLYAEDWFTQWPQAIRCDGTEAPTHWMPLPVAPVVDCTGCDGRGEVGGLRADGYHSEICPYCKGSGLEGSAA